MGGMVGGMGTGRRSADMILTKTNLGGARVTFREAR